MVECEGNSRLLCQPAASEPGNKTKKTQLVYFNNGFFYPRYCRQLPTSLEELLEYQWEQGAQFLMQQASQYDGIMLILRSNVTRIASKIVVAHVHQENIPYLVIIYFFFDHLSALRCTDAIR